jgi:integrase
VSELPVRKYVKVWIKKRKNRKRQGEKKQTVSYTLQWVEFGKESYQSLGPHATLSFAKEAARRKEAELNSFQRQASLEPIDWKAFVKKYLDTMYPGHDKPATERKEAERGWSKSFKTMRREKNAMDSFERLTKPGFCHEITAEDRERFVQKRLGEVGSGLTIDAELRAIRYLCNVMEEWKHRPEGSNPFAGKGKATVGGRRTRQKAQGTPGKNKVEKHYSFEEVKTLLALATKEAQENPTVEKKRFRVLAYFMAYTGCRINEAVHLEWKDVDFDRGVAWLYFKVENDLKTEGSQAPFGLPQRLLAVLREWKEDEDRIDCSWVFANSRKKPWKGGAPGYRPFDQMQELGVRAGIKGANFKRFRHSMSTHGKQRFGMTAEQVRAQLRHTTTETQEHYTHDDIANLREAVKKVDFEG